MAKTTRDSPEAAAVQPVIPPTAEVLAFFAEECGTPQARGHIETAVALLRGGVQAGEIANARYDDAKFTVGGAFQDAWRRMVSSNLPYDGRNAECAVLQKALPSYLQIADVARTAKKLPALAAKTSDAKAVAILTQVQAFLDGAMPLASALEFLKTRRVKRAPAADKPVEEALPAATREARRLVRDALSVSLENIRADYHAHVTSVFAMRAAQFAASLASGNKPMDVRRATQSIVLFDRIYDLAGGHRGITASVRPDAATMVAKLVDQTVEATFSSFLHKNVEKLAAIVELKGGGHPRIILGRAHLHAGTVETSMDFKFPDGSAFEVRNQAVEQRSHLGTFYVRFPTTFHDVMLSDGSRLASPSERDMKSVFVGISAPAQDDPEDEEEPSAPRGP